MRPRCDSMCGTRASRSRVKRSLNCKETPLARGDSSFQLIFRPINRSVCPPCKIGYVHSELVQRHPSTLHEGMDRPDRTSVPYCLLSCPESEISFLGSMTLS
jgi:hypothetical protein